MNVRPRALRNQSFGWKEVSKCHCFSEEISENLRKSSLKIHGYGFFDPRDFHYRKHGKTHEMKHTRPDYRHSPWSVKAAQ
jgi:hypothetical protein